jgi:hypothetical protein
MIFKRVVALRDAYPLGLEHEKYWRIKKGTLKTVTVYPNGGSLTIKTKWGIVHYDPRHFRDLTNVEKLTGRKL